MMRKTQPPTRTAIKQRSITSDEAKVIAARLDEVLVQVMRLARAVEKLAGDNGLDEVRPRGDGARPQVPQGVR
jgi:hypothetical protein